ncbi:EF-1 guanine nucleotide exchange domain-containing protein [Ditylenchus destructor]|nr:EF-1 guanine nucleotide exchange domain-containing protein [Ditylenchus destructor]
MSALAFSQGKVSTNDVKQLDEFNTYLASRAYVNGFAPSKEDEVAHKSFASAPAQKHPHIARWHKHIASFDDKERSSWPKQSQGGEAAPAAAGGDDFDLFGSESEDDEEKERVKQERLKAYAEKKSKKPGPIAKSNIIYDVKPWDDTIDVKEIEKHVRSIECDGLVWGASKILPIAYGVNKLQICCVVEDDKVSSDWLEEKITENEDLVQSVDVVAFNKV